ncbi:MAG: V-type ATPase 116kDa subunit family protein [Candidatus Omnitrophota bacterium]
MAIARIKKIQILGHTSDQELVLSHLQGLGVVEVTRVDEVLLPAQPAADGAADLEKRLRSLKEGIDNLGLYDVAKSCLFTSLFKAHPVIQIEEIKAAVSSGIYQQILVEIKEKEAEIKKLEGQVQRIDSELELLKPWEGANLTIQDLSPSRHTHTFLGIINHPGYVKFSDDVQSKGLPVFCAVINHIRKQRYLVVVYHVDNREEVEDVLEEHNFNFFILPEALKKEEAVSLTIKQCLDLFKDRLNRLRLELDRVKEGVRKLLPKRVLLMGLYDYFFNLRSRLLAAQSLGSTQQAFLLEGWIRERDLGGLETRLKGFSSLAIFSRAALPDEDIPVDLENKPYFAPFEVITSLYGMPARYSIDPTPFLAPFFFIFFGLCLTDAGYGLIITIAALVLLKKLKLEKPAKRILNLFLYCGISTIILGTFLGGWFGLPVKQLMLFDPMKNPIIFLIIALGLGFIQVEFGLFIKLLQDIRNKQFVDAFLVRLSWILLLPALLLIFMKVHWAKNIIFITAGSIVLFSQHRIKNIFVRLAGGLYSLYDIMKYFADVVSYSRLLALGLSTSVIAMVVNTLSRQALGIPLIGGVVMVAVLVFGHLFNLAINTLSGFVHSARLQFIEFFGKFFEGGGRSFRPFRKEKIYC